MKRISGSDHPRILAALALVFSLLPALLAGLVYREARRKDELVFQTTAQVLGQQLQSSFERHTYFPIEIRNRGRELDQAALGAGKMVPEFRWMEQLPHLITFGYAEGMDGPIHVRWRSAERVATVAVGDDLANVPGVVAAVKTTLPMDPTATMGCVVEKDRMLVLLALPGNRSNVATYGYVFAFVDLASMCRDAKFPLLRDGILSAKPLGATEAADAGAKSVEVRDRAAVWQAGITRGPAFGKEYAMQTPWLVFLAAGLSAVPLLILASLAGRATRLRAALAVERESASQQRFFTQSVSHEFRTPLGIILSGTDLLDRYAEHLTNERRSEILAEIRDNTTRMTEMVEAVLLLGRIESGKLSCSPQTVNLTELCLGIVRTVHAASGTENGISVSAPDEQASLDANLVSGILQNLLANAVKYSPLGSPVSLAVVMEKGRVIFTVSDEGIGIPQEDQSRVFEPFHRCGNVGEIPGTGLGLAIAKRYAGLHGGTLGIESTVGLGTVITVKIDLT